MKRPTFESTIDILVKAYLNDTLEHGNYCACAVGNIIAEAVGAEIVKNRSGMRSKFAWIHPVYTGGEWFNCISTGNKQIQATGYSFDEIRRIEKAFEGDRLYKSDMFNGLMAVVDVLAEIHNVDLSIRDDAKVLFVKH